MWAFLADTRQINRAIGLPPIEFTITPVESGGSHVEAEIRLAGRTVSRWTEHPFLWREPHGYVVLREFHGGPIESARGGVELSPAGGGTDLRVFADFVPRNRFGGAILRAGLGQRTTAQIVKQCRVFERHLEGREHDPFPQLLPRKPLDAGVRMLADRLLAAGAERALVEPLYAHLTRGRDDEVVRMRPFELADRWGRDRRATLALFLRATTVGLVTMSWDILCPNCRVGKAEYLNLKDLRGQAHCDTCNIVFNANFDRLVEVRFSVAPTVRKVVHREYCIGGPMSTPHVVAQIPLAPGEQQRLICRFGAGPYRVRSPQSAHDATVEAVEDDMTGELHVAITPDGLEPQRASVATGQVALTVENQTGLEALLAVEGSSWPSTIATAAVVSTMQEFRDLFSSHALAPGLQLGIERLAFLFTDLIGSTALYQRVGQARAFRIVQDHFLILGDAITAHRGALIKTIGDAVMASFETSADALAAGIAIQRDVRGLDVDRAVDPARLVRVGIHEGPCVAVTLNDRLDYFGTTVNVAARVEHEALGGEIVATADACEAAGRAIVTAARATIEPDILHLRGIRDPVRIYRIRVP